MIYGRTNVQRAVFSSTFYFFHFLQIRNEIVPFRRAFQLFRHFFDRCDEQFGTRVVRQAQLVLRHRTHLKRDERILFVRKIRNEQKRFVDEIRRLLVLFEGQCRRGNEWND